MSWMFIRSRLYGSLSWNPRMHLTMKWKRKLSIGCTTVEPELTCHTCVKILGWPLIHFKLHLSTLLVVVKLISTGETHETLPLIRLESSLCRSVCIPIVLHPIFKLWFVGETQEYYHNTAISDCTTWTGLVWHCMTLLNRIVLSFCSEAVFLFLKTAAHALSSSFIKVPRSS